MLRTKITTLLCLAVLITVTAAQAFDYASYKPGNLDDILAMPRPKTGVDVVSFQKLNLKVTLESYAEKECGLAKLLTFSMSMLPTAFPREFVDALSESKCIKVKSAKGSTATVAIQDKVADFLPKEVPLGTEIQVYCVLICLTAEGPGLIVTEFEAPQACLEDQLMKAANDGDVVLVNTLLAKGADVNSSTKNGFTALVLADKRGRNELLRYSKTQGAK